MLVCSLKQVMTKSVCMMYGSLLSRVPTPLPMPGEAKTIKIRVSPREIPLVRGYRNEGLSRIEKRTGAKVKGVYPDDSLSEGKIEVERG